MKKRLLRMAALLLICCLACAGCARYSTEISDLIVPPEASGDLAEIRAALEAAAGKDITLRYPKSGDYRSAFVVYDIDGDSKNEVFAFYSTVSDDNITVMHMNFIVRRNGVWCSVNDFSFEASGAEWVRFTDITGDGNPEAVISWAVTASPIKKLTVFCFRTDELISYLSEDYTTYTACSLDGDRDILILKNDTVAKQARAKLLRLEADGVRECGICAIDSGAVSYESPIVATLPDGTPAVYIDADKGTEGMITELFYWQEGALVNPFIGDAQSVNTATLRASGTPCADYNEDGIPEIPLITPLPSPTAADAGDTAYLTDWMQWNKTGFVSVKALLINNADGYSFTVDEELRDNLAVEKNTQNAERIFYAYDAESPTPYTELFRIRTLPSKARASEMAPVLVDYQRLGAKEDVLYLALIRSNTLKIDLAYLKDHFAVLEQKES